MSTIQKVVSEGIKSNYVKKMIQHLENFNFMTVNKGDINFGYNGESLKQNIYNEWMVSNLITCDEPSFHSMCVDHKSDPGKTFNAVSPMVKSLPCNIVKSTYVTNLEKSTKSVTDNYDIFNILNDYFNKKSGMTLFRYLFCKPDTSDDLLYKLQRNRKMWWKKFSASPGRFTVSPIISDGNSQFMEIQAGFIWGTISVEKIMILHKWPEEELLFNEEGESEPVSPHVIIAETNLEKSALTMMCDSYESEEDNGRQMLRFHRKIAPFKIAFSAVCSTQTDERNLKDLSLLLTKQIRKNLISVLLLPDMCSCPLEDQIARNDALGIPYTVVMDEKTLKTGLLEIHSRDTTLREQSHVSQIVQYVEKLMKNY